MGMAASQVRYLALQNRNNTIGLNLMTLANRRTALERDMSRVAKLYNEAMNEKMLKLSTDSGVTYKDLSYDTLMKSSAGISKLPYIITDANGRAVLDDTELIVNGKNTGFTYKQLAQIISQCGITGRNLQQQAGYSPLTPTDHSATCGDGHSNYNSESFFDANDNVNNLRVDLFSKLGLIDISKYTSNSDYVIGWKRSGETSYTMVNPHKTQADFSNTPGISDEDICLLANGETIKFGELGKNYTTSQKNLKAYLKTVSHTPEMKYFDAIFSYISENGWVYDETINNPNRPSQSRNALHEKLRNNIYYLTEASAEDLKAESKIGYDTKIALNTGVIYDTYDTASQNAALATYEAEKSDIQSKEKQIDLRMSRLETEQSAIKTELDSIKTIINDNVNSTFKIFG